MADKAYSGKELGQVERASLLASVLVGVGLDSTEQALILAMPEIVLDSDLSLDGATDDLGVIVNIVVPLLVGSLLFALCFYRWVTRGEAPSRGEARQKYIRRFTSGAR